MGIIKRLFGSSYGDRAWRDQHKLSTIGKNIISPINDYGTCFSCGGSGSKTLTCKPCSGSGKHTFSCRGCNGSGLKHFEPKICLGCQGTGRHNNKECNRCGGSGYYKPAVTVSCNRCEGTGRITQTCNKCSGSGSFNVTCLKCSGSGWHKF